MCNCDKRRAAIIAGTKALIAGDRKTAADQAKFIARSSVEDLSTVSNSFRQRVAASRVNLTRR